MTDVVNDVIINYESHNLDATVGGIKQTSVALDGLVIASSSSEKATAALENRFKSLERSLGTPNAKLDEFAKKQKTIDDALAQNPALQTRANEATAALALKYGVVSGAANAMATATGAAAKATDVAANSSKLARYELINLSRQLQDVGVSLFSGQSPLTVGVQQGSQIFDIYASSGVKFGDSLKQLGGIASGILTPVRLLAGGVIGLGAAAVYMAVQWDNAQKETERSLAGIGQRTATTAGDISQFAKSNASATGLSISQARTAAIEFTKTGAVSIAGLRDLGEAVHGYAALTGTDATEATKKLASAFSGDLAKGADELNKSYGFLDSATRSQIQALQLQGDRMGAVQILIDKMAPSNKKAADSVDVLTKAWTAFKNVASNIINPDPNRETPQDKLATAQSRQAEFNAGTSPFQNEKGFGQSIAKEVADAQKAVDSLKTEAVQAQLRAMSEAGDAVVKSIIPQIEQIDNLKLALAALQNAQNTPGVSRSQGADDAAVIAIQNQLAALKESQAEAARYNIEVQNISSSWGNVGQSVALQLQAMQNALPVAKAWTEAGRMKAQYEATYLNNLNKGKTAQEATALASKEEELSKASAVASAQKMVQSSEDNLAKIQAQGTEMEGVVASSIAYRDAIQAGATQTQAAAIAANTLAANMLQAAKNADQMAQSATDAVAAGMKAAGGAGNYYYGGNNSGGGSFADRSFTGDSKTITGLMSGTEQFYRAAASISPSASDLISQASASGNTDAAISALKDARVITGLQYGAGTVTFDSLGFPKGSQDDITTALMSLYDIKKNQSSDPNAVTRDEIATLQSLPQDQKTLDAIASLTESLNSVNGSTQALTQSNQDLLSPYYTQDPRTSHIGFRSQGMASGGEFTVPGGYSANDNMLGTIPLASGEIVSVRRPGESSGGVKNINITNNITIGAGANVDQFKRTIFQSTQNQARQLRAAS